MPLAIASARATQNYPHSSEGKGVRQALEGVGAVQPAVGHCRAERRLWYHRRGFCCADVCSPSVTSTPHVTVREQEGEGKEGDCGKGWGQGCIGRGGAPPSPLQGAQPTPSHCPPDAKCRAQWHL